MLFDWSGFMPAWVNNGVGMLGLGPYFNLLPLLTIALFIVQQKMFMPPPTDEQTAMQQKMMNYMMIFMGVLFYKVAAGLCIYFIASSLWGIAERKFLPKNASAAGGRQASTTGTDVGDREDRRAAMRRRGAAAPPERGVAFAKSDQHPAPPNASVMHALDDTIAAIASPPGGAARGSCA